MVDVTCTLCNKTIENYHIKLNQLILNESQTVEICSVCVNRFIIWQQMAFAKYYPTKAAKKWVERKKD